MAKPAEGRPALTFILTVFLSAILLFQIQPMIAKAILPWFGGAAAVWTTCMLFFQVVLLLGYVYAHGLIQRLPLRWQLIVHLSLILASLAALPVRPDPQWRPNDSVPALYSLLRLLLATVGAPYLILSTTSPLVQAWLARSSKTTVPYRLFAISNIASLLGLMAYPFVIEPLIPMRAQLSGWSVGYVLFAVAVLGTAVKVWRNSKTEDRTSQKAPDVHKRIGIPMWILWVSLPACGSALLLAGTNSLCQDTAPVPFLWILPLSCYLATFVLCFGFDRWYRPLIFRWLLAPVFATYVFTSDAQRHDHMGFTIVLITSVVLFGCMFCHGELVRLKPDLSRLTSFYFALALGGAIGGIFVTIIAPFLYPSYVELFVSVIACAFLVSSVAYRGESNRVVATVTSVAIVMAALAVAAVTRAGSDGVVRTRNFYGALRVEDAETANGRVRSLIHGSTVHGKEFLKADGYRAPTTYYGPQSGVGMAIAALPSSPKRLGVVGLGAGTLAAYASEGDYLRFYEINAEISRIARTCFGYLSHCGGRYDVILGDARLSMEHEDNQNFDLLALDAFSGDAVPVHLLTVEAFRVYLRHLKSDGVLAVHVSNEYLELAPVVRASLEQQTGMQIRVFETAGDPKLDTSQATWVIATSNRAVIESGMWRKGQTISRRIRAWTDEYSNLFRIVKW